MDICVNGHTIIILSMSVRQNCLLRFISQELTPLMHINCTNKTNNAAKCKFIFHSLSTNVLWNQRGIAGRGFLFNWDEEPCTCRLGKDMCNLASYFQFNIQIREIDLLYWIRPKSLYFSSEKMSIKIEHYITAI